MNLPNIQKSKRVQGIVFSIPKDIAEELREIAKKHKISLRKLLEEFFKGEVAKKAHEAIRDEGKRD